MRPLEHAAVQQSHEDAQEIVDILTAASTDCRMSQGLRARLTAVRERAERISRNTAGDVTEAPNNQHGGSVQIPTLHLNGSSAETLRHQYATAIEALRQAVDATCEAAPNDRDYYVQGPGAGPAARREHEARVAALQRVRAELVTIADGIRKQLMERAR